MIADTELVLTKQPSVAVIAAVVGVVACARMTKLVIDDDFPPVLWVRRQIAKMLPPAWLDGLDCPWCVSVYIVLVDVIWAWASGLHWSWWLGNVWAAGSWAAAYLYMRDVPEDMRE